MRDISIRTDRLLGKLFSKIEERVTAGDVLVVLTADHGVAPVPEENQKRHMPGGRLDALQLTRAMTAALTRRFGPGNWFLPASVSMAYLNREQIVKGGFDRSQVERVAAETAAAQPHIARVYTRTQLANGSVQSDPIGRAFLLGFNAQRSGDLFILPEPYYLFEATGTSHGTPYDYDTHVPVIFLGPGIKAGRYAGRIAVNDIAPTLSEILGVEQPSGFVGRVLSEILQ